MKIQNTLVLNIRGRSQRYFAHVTTVTLSWRVQNIVVIGRVYSKLEHSEFSSNFEFDRNMLSGTGARIASLHHSVRCKKTVLQEFLLHNKPYLVCAFIDIWIPLLKAGTPANFPFLFFSHCGLWEYVPLLLLGTDIYLGKSQPKLYWKLNTLSVVINEDIIYNIGLSTVTFFIIKMVCDIWYGFIF